MAITDVSFTTFTDADLAVTDTDQYTAPALTKSLILSMILSNKTAGVVAVTVKIIRTSGPVTLTVVKDAPIPPGGSLELIDNKPIILNAADKVQAACTTGGASAVDVTGSVMEAAT